jgi:hypothetical protein
MVGIAKSSVNGEPVRKSQINIPLGAIKEEIDAAQDKVKKAAAPSPSNRVV